MADGAVNFFLDQTDDPLLPDGIPSFDGGQFSNLRANLLQPNQSKLLGNCDIDKLGKLRTRRGTILIGSGPPDPTASDAMIQGLTSFQTPDYNYIIAAHNRKLWKWTGSAWEHIALGGARNDAEIVIERTGRINLLAGYDIGDTALVVDGLPAVGAPLLAAGDKLYFKSNIRTDYYEYIIAGWNAGANTITLEEPGLVFPVNDNWEFVVLRPAAVNNGAGYPAGTTTIAIDGYTGEVNNGERFVILAENRTHTVSGHTQTGGNTTGLTFSPSLQADWLASANNVPIVFAQGNDQIFFCDGTGPIYGWDGETLSNLSAHSFWDLVIDSPTTLEQKTPPTGATVLIWFQNRLIASGIASEPDAVYFSDFFDPTSWDNLYQKVRIGGGESDPITGLHAWTDLNMLVFKKNSIYIVNCDPSQNPNPDDPTLLVASFSVKQLHKRIGCPAPNTAVQVGGGSTTPGSDVFFVDGDKKVHSIRRVMAAETQQEVGQAVSLPIQDVLDTINLEHIATSTAFYHNEHYLLGFPSTRGTNGGMLPNGVATYNLLTQSWCGVWSWAPTCFAMRTDLGSYSKMIFGDEHGRVVQWMDDQSLDEETPETYQDRGTDFPTTILTRAITFGDSYSFKTGLSVEFEFDESWAEDVIVKVILDKVPHRDLIAIPFSTLSDPRLRVPFVIPAVLPPSPDLLRKGFDLQRYGTWRELQFYIYAEAGKLAIRSIRVTGFMDTIRLQTLPMAGIPALEVPPPDSSGGP